jgi:hypothetical protein
VALQAIGMWLLTQVAPGSAEIDVVRDIVLIGVGTGFAMPLYQNALMSAVPVSVIGVASSQLQFWRQMGATASLALLGTILSHRLATTGVGVDSELGGATVPLQARDAISAALHDAFLVATVLILIALVASLFMEDVPLRGHSEREGAQAPASSFAD